MATNFLDEIRTYFIVAIMYSRLPRPEGHNYLTLAAKVLGIPVVECRRLVAMGANNRAAYRIGYRWASLAIERRRSLENLPPFHELICEVDIAEFCDWMMRHGRIREMVDYWNDLQAPEEQDGFAKKTG